MVLSMTNFGRDEVVRKRQGALEQILRRGVHRFQLPDQPLRADVKIICAANGLDFPARGARVEFDVGGRVFGEQPYELLRQLGKQAGLKAITERIRYARKLAERGGYDIDWATFARAHLMIQANAEASNDW